MADPDDDPINIVPGSGGVFRVTCNGRTVRFQCPYHHGSTTVPGHLELRVTDLQDDDIVEMHLRNARDAGEELVIAVDVPELDLGDLAQLATRAGEHGVKLTIRHDG